MAKLYNGGYTYPNGISVAAGKPLDDRLVLNSVEDLYINSSTRNAGTAVLNKIAYTGMPVIIANNGNPYVLLLKNSEPYENGSTTEVNASNYTTYWTIPGKSVEDYISGTIDPSINKLETRLEKADSSIGILNSSVSSLESHISNTDSSISTLDSSVNVLETHLGKTDSSIVILNSSVSDLESHISNTDSSVSTLDSSLNELNTSLGQLYVDFEAFGNDMTYSINTLNSSYNNLVDEIIANEEVFSAAITDLDKKIAENDVRDYISGTIDPSINKLETHLEKTDSSIVILNSSVSNLESHISKTDTSVSTLNSSVDVLETHVSEIDTSIGTLNSSISNLETHISNTDASVSTLDSSVDALETHVSEIDTSIGTLNSSVSTFETRISNIDSSISTLNSSVNVLETHLGKTDSSILNSSVSSLETHISNIDTSVSTLDSSLNELNTSLGQLYVDFDAFGNDVTYSINTLNSSYNNLVDEIIANEEVVAAAITDLDAKIAENDVRDYISGTIDPSINKLETEIVLHGNKLNNYAETFPQNPVASLESNGLMSVADKVKVDNYPEQFVLDLGIVESQAYGEREAAKSEVAGNRNISFIRFQVRGVKELKTTLIMQWPNGIHETAQIMCVDKQQWRRNVTGATGVVGAPTNAYNWSRTAPHSIVYDEQRRIIQLKDYENQTVSQEVELPLASSSQHGLMSITDKEKISAMESKLSALEAQVAELKTRVESLEAK